MSNNSLIIRDIKKRFHIKVTLFNKANLKMLPHDIYNTFFKIAIFSFFFNNLKTVRNFKFFSMESEWALKTAQHCSFKRPRSSYSFRDPNGSLINLGHPVYYITWCTLSVEQKSLLDNYCKIKEYSCCIIYYYVMVVSNTFPNPTSACTDSSWQA